MTAFGCRISSPPLTAGDELLRSGSASRPVDAGAELCAGATAAVSTDVPDQATPNRAFVHAATSQGYTYNADWKPKFNCKTLYDRINANKSLSWRSYYHDQDDILELYPYLEKDETNHVQFEGNFVSDVAGDKLATYSFITPAFLNSPQHPTNSMHAPADVRPAEKLVADVYSALRSQPIRKKPTSDAGVASIASITTPRAWPPWCRRGRERQRRTHAHFSSIQAARARAIGFLLSFFGSGRR